MTEEHDVNRTVADLADGVTRIVNGRAKTALAHPRDEPLDRIAFAARDARDLDEATDEIQVGRIRTHRR